MSTSESSQCAEPLQDIALGMKLAKGTGSCHKGHIERAFQRQQGIFQNSKVAGKKSVKNSRWYMEVLALRPQGGH
ncbi:MAG: hypothetical protein BYD32DRAFT_462815 [Podila humilis]|nr:MAG: hypothetical protein BYD32DRAFT_462815 [Podila humilis]